MTAADSSRLSAAGNTPGGAVLTSWWPTPDLLLRSMR